MSIVEQEKMATVEPLSLESDRRNVQRRFIGPVCAALTINAIDVLYEREETLLTEASDSLRDRFEGWHVINYKDLLWGVSDALEAVRHQLVQESRRPFEGHGETNYGLSETQNYFPPLQQQLIKKNITHCILGPRLREGIQSQFAGIFSVGLPGYLIARYDLESPAQIIGSIKTLGWYGVSELIQEPSFEESLSILAVTANGLHRNSNGAFVDHGNNTAVLDVRDAVRGHAFEIDENVHGNVPDPISVYELYQKQPNGEVQLSKEAVATLRYFIRLRNSMPENVIFGEIDGFSKGCPVVQHATYLNGSDLTERQWQQLTEGDNPIATYDETTQKLVFKRSVFKELNGLFAGVLKSAAMA